MKSPKLKWNTSNDIIASELTISDEASAPTYWQWRPETWLHARLRQTRRTRVPHSLTSQSANLERWHSYIRSHVACLEAVRLAEHNHPPENQGDSHLGIYAPDMVRRRG